MTLVAISVAVFILMTLFDQRKVVGPLLISEYIRPTLPEILDGELWRLFTPVFLHFGIFHIVFNMLWTWELGRLIEWRQGIWMLGILTLVVSISSNLAQYFVSGPLFGGMSGVIYGYFGYVWIQSLTNPQFKIQLNPVIVKLLLGWFLICWTGLLEKIFGLNVANSAHTAGLVSGIVIALLVSGVIRLSAKPG
jgi:GlpG protein